MTPTQDSQTKGTVYVCGPMRGQPLHNFPAFFQAEAMLQLWGYVVKNPARMDIEEGKAHYNHNAGTIILDNSFTMEEALRRDFKVILNDCDALAVLHGWPQSEGAQKEIAFAKSIGLPVFEYLSEHPLDIASAQQEEISVSVQCGYSEVPF